LPIPLEIIYGSNDQTIRPNIFLYYLKLPHYVHMYTLAGFGLMTSEASF
jgi:hypothetical protein